MSPQEQAVILRALQRTHRRHTLVVSELASRGGCSETLAQYREETAALKEMIARVEREVPS